ncbi:NTP pyrophosphatase (non-canonical NTP hydrolase) [Actinoplanes octamycinicus]|uniref:NTP pyrophosphatase (Non-canonical NTP hydrolase) n=1 Tax=Actinoplanes octamycinicus TaxID=135948 RepID=A0A7W7H595_9ACTN|nr:MazG-like family protein [Actinoplanes octamycinicus]MBB4744158.1 NTP pyrophosphatase (non-canonical NTP hydrolase) [Actinoplanes octamycinicus]GIE56886.1 hypothetical protein Aoc01nite_22880 [Actinoplanes octamycinicus]
MPDDDFIWSEAHRWRAHLDARNGAGPAELTLRLLKLTEEAGEVAQAWIGAQGQNPRKGVTHTVDDVVAELADVVFTSLVAIASLGGDPRQAVTDCVVKAAGYLDAAPAPDR